jgi:protein involved in polysaccharide export with SLBB domain
MKLKTINILRTILLLLTLCTVIPAISQTTNPKNLSGIRVDDLTDQQVIDNMQKLKATGLPDDKLEQAAIAQGMSPEEFKKLRTRADKIKGSTSEGQLPQTGRQLTSPQDTLIRQNLQDASDVLSDLKPKIFGADLFKTSNSFVANLNIATPVNYQIGSGDQIKINVYGNSSVDWNLPVSPEGTINIPSVGILNLRGRTIEQATKLIKDKLATNNYAIGRGTNAEVTLGNIRTIRVTVIGEVVKPGTYPLPSLATVYNALESAGGPSENGSFREIRVVRNNRVLATVDIYDFLINGFDINDIRLQDQDRIVIPVYKNRVEFAGEIKRPMIFEALPDETLQNVINFAGGFTSRANTSLIRVFQNASTQRRQADVSDLSFNSYKVKSGDKYFVSPILERFENRVTIEGAVFRPDQYELTLGLTLKQLIEKASGPKEDAFSRGIITRLKTDNSIESQSFDIQKILAGTDPDIPLQREDKIKITSIFDTRDAYKVIITGEVRQSGEFDYAEKMTPEDLVLLSGGFKEGASPKRILVSRRIKNSDVNSVSAVTAQVYQVDLDKDLKFTGSKFLLQPFDIVTVYNSVGYEKQKQVRIEGEVQIPGNYTILRKDERISDLVNRAGGLTAMAYSQGASLKRPGTKAKSKTEDKEQIAKLQRLQSTVRDTLRPSEQKEVIQNINVGINLDKILLKPKSDYDLVLEEGDTLRIPKQFQTVKVSGEVSSPIKIIYSKGKRFRQYISQAGGFSDKSLKGRSYVLYANGSVKGTNKILFFNNYPQVKPGAEIFIPMKDVKRKLSASEIVGLSTGMATLAALILSLLKL